MADSQFLECLHKKTGHLFRDRVISSDIVRNEIYTFAGLSSFDQRFLELSGLVCVYWLEGLTLSELSFWESAVSLLRRLVLLFLDRHLWSFRVVVRLFVNCRLENRPHLTAWSGVDVFLLADFFRFVVVDLWNYVIAQL